MVCETAVIASRVAFVVESDRVRDNVWEAFPAESASAAPAACPALAISLGSFFVAAAEASSATFSPLPSPPAPRSC
ncbi:hypothetical protein KGD82_16300 [Nocardiopsis eucommiae]|uniref:Uncharacterized protein n=1 Tax=Nocardiopsis eucommiae TaxID=2831970 RepID=A0A975L7H6_9ACTN|nr:hypothetical protein KGD82_16300 [Nocardiopsis eucommiae]